MRGASLLALAVLPACLTAPPDGVGGEQPPSDATASDAQADCLRSLTLSLRGEDDLTGWTAEDGADCTHAVTTEGLEFTNSGNPSTCRVYSDRLVNLGNLQRLRVRLVDHDADLSMAFTLVVGSSDLPLADRRWLYFERDNGQLLFGECSPALEGCDDTHWGSLAYQPGVHVWLSFKYDPAGGALALETSADGSSFDMVAAAGGLSDDDVACAAVDLGSYELDTGGASSRSAFADLVFQ